MDIFIKSHYKTGIVPFNLEVFYPRINSTSIIDKCDKNKPLLKAIGLSKHEIYFISEMYIKEGNFLEFSMQVENGYSFNCTTVVKAAKIHDNGFLVCCEFILVSSFNMKLIEQFVEQKGVRR